MNFLQQATTWRKLAAVWMEFLYPSVCEVCQAGLKGVREGAGRWLCAPCHDELPALPVTCCKVCGTPYRGQITDEFRCGNCAGRTIHFDFATSAYHAEAQMRQLIHRYKYQKELYLRGLMAGLLADAFRRDHRLKALSPTDWVMVPVPLHWIRHWQRGFNQSWELCKELTRLTQIPAVDALQRVRYTRVQARLGRSERLKNLKGSFRLRRRWLGDVRNALKNRKVLLIDDVLTTGSTVNECAKVLRSEAGVQKVVVISVARG